MSQKNQAFGRVGSIIFSIGVHRRLQCGPEGFTFVPSGFMASKDEKGNEVKIANKGLKRLRKGMKGSSSSAAKGTHARRFGAKVVEPHGLKWFQEQKEAKYVVENWIDKGRIAFELPTIHDKVRELRLGYVFAVLEECNLTLVVASVVISCGSSSVID
ncbi:hypothetical protein HAX54_024300 [Datura stramonium]|uniref:Uncharacterized protein n=1 Tax=Datura stramonium TaxID=4076 RepID=A0ABS8UXR6_DATST|nr:hypothetical protein [Datura stramonium]